MGICTLLALEARPSHIDAQCTFLAQCLELTLSKPLSLKTAINLSPEYIELAKPGESFRGIFWGFTEITVNDQVTDEQRQIPAAAFLVDKCIRINGGVALVSECKKAGIDKGTPLEVTFKEKKGNLKIYSLTLLA